MKRRQTKHGYTLLEALLLVMVLGITGAATGKALTAMTHSPEQNDKELAVEAALLDKVEFLRSLSYATLAAEAGKSQSAYSDSTSIGSTSVARVVTVNYIVPSTGAVAGSGTHMLQLNVTVAGKSATTLMAEP
jgi:type II secretory pathway pseudopilin PulG